MNITEKQIHITLFCVYDRAGDLMGAFPTLDKAEDFMADKMYGPEK